MHCNPLVNHEAHKFKGEKDIDDTIRQIRFKLKIKKGAFFPIIKRGEKDIKKWLKKDARVPARMLPRNVLVASLG